MKTPSFRSSGSCCEFPPAPGGAMLPVYLNDLRRNAAGGGEEMVEVTLELDGGSVVLCGVAPAEGEAMPAPAGGDFLSRSASAASRLRRMFSRRWAAEEEEQRHEAAVDSAREAMRARVRMMRDRSGAQRALGGLRFISRSGAASGGGDSSPEAAWREVERRFDALAEGGLLSRQDFGECIVLFLYRADINGDGKITRDEVQELIMLSASANKLSNLKEGAKEYASLIMEELDPERLGYIELWQLETLLLQRDSYMNYSRPLSTETIRRSQNLSSQMATKIVSFVFDNWQRGLILAMWILAMAGLFTWKFLQYRQKAAFQIMVHGIIHLTCDFPRLVRSSPEKFELIASDFHGKKPTYTDLLTGIIGITGFSMVVLMVIAFTLATRRFRRNILKFPPPFNRITGFNAFWYSHHLLVLVYVLLLFHGTFLFLVHQWYKKTTWMYISIPLLLYVAERSLSRRRSEHCAVKILKVSVLPGGVFSLVMAKPNGFKYKSGQYVFLQCPVISSFEWHPFSLTSAPGDDYLSVHIRTVGDWTQELKSVFTEDNSSTCVIGRAKFGAKGNVNQTGLPKLLVDGPYGAPAQDYQNYDVLLLVGLGIGATPFISILKDLLNNTKQEDLMDSNTDTSRSENSSNSITSSCDTSNSKKKSHKTRSAHFYWVTREPGSFEWFKGVMNEVAEMDLKGQIEMHNYLTSVYEEGDARSTLITMVQALNHAKHGVDILSGTRVRTHFARPDWREVFSKIAVKHPCCTVGVFYCGAPNLAKELKKLSQELTYKTSTRFEFHKEYF
ncbi:Riboflavin synthase-like superfamily protein [Striga hermonthica]|uniref:Riboflavin synthase-like superfamily protein n=1 Tax=Striga hermonthica TaxID=68872 RepID=A0A9N7MI78_STRHE|nr:Riboflavin synthase-like superfamily protein [Striga hermonthica]